MEKLTVTLKGVTHTFDIEADQANVHITITEVFAAFGLEASAFELVPVAHLEPTVEGEGKQIAA